MATQQDFEAFMNLSKMIATSRLCMAGKSGIQHAEGPADALSSIAVSYCLGLDGDTKPRGQARLELGKAAFLDEPRLSGQSIRGF